MAIPVTLPLLRQYCLRSSTRTGSVLPVSSRDILLPALPYRTCDRTAYPLAVPALTSFAAAPGRVAALRPASGAGIRVDVGVGEGDEITAGLGSVIATVAAWGRDQREALRRLHRGLMQSVVVVDSGTTSKALLLTLIGGPEFCAGSYDRGWLDRLTAAVLLPPQHPVALLQGAIEAADDDQAAVQAAFFAGSGPRQPAELPADAGHQVELSLGGNSYLMHVYCLGRGHYRVEAGHGLVDANVQRLGRYERVVTCGGGATAPCGRTGPRLMIEVDGVSHVSPARRQPRPPPAPAFVVGVQVAPGDLVRAGDPLVVVESMKMETTITAPFAGTVRAVTASAQHPGGGGRAGGATAARTAVRIPGPARGWLRRRG